MKKLGTYEIGYECVDVFVDSTSSCGSFNFLPDPKLSKPSIMIGLDSGSWKGTMNILLHEAFEFVLARHQLRFTSCSKMSQDTSDYTFIFNHPQFSSVCSHVADFVAIVMPDLLRTWKRSTT